MRAHAPAGSRATLAQRSPKATRMGCCAERQAASATLACAH